MHSGTVPRADWWRDVLIWGRLLSVTIIVLGAALAIWNAIDLGGISEEVYGSHYALRTSTREVLLHAWYGALILIVTEIVGSAGGDDLHAGRIDWQIPQLTRVLAALIVVGGTALTIWDLRELGGSSSFDGGILGLNIVRQGGLTVSDSVRYFLEQELRQYLWQGGMLILLAALADRLGWRANDESLDEREGLAPTDAAQ